MAQHSDIVTGATVVTADGHTIGKVIEATSEEFIVQEGKHEWAFHYDAVGTATPHQVVVTFGQAALKGEWNTVNLRDAHGRERSVIQVGVPRTNRVPYYDEVQTTTGGPPTGEADERA